MTTTNGNSGSPPTHLGPLGRSLVLILIVLLSLGSMWVLFQIAGAAGISTGSITYSNATLSVYVGGTAAIFMILLWLMARVWNMLRLSTSLLALRITGFLSQ